MKNRKGFTITELVIVIAVIAILAAVLIPTFSGVINKANSSAVTQETRAAVNALLTEKNGQIPENTYVVYQKGSTTEYFKYENGKLNDVDTIPSYKDGDEVFAKQVTTDIIKVGEEFVKNATVLTDLSANVEILVSK
ncbi:MAG: type II secretion system protein [Oscillospiraceae bacterium]|nr:type II secretion system protein [Oscillospiraceae bacterium]